MAENVIQNIQSIELGSIVVDDVTPTHCIMFQTARNRYCFRLSEQFPVEKQIAMFRQFIVDINTPLEQPTTTVQPVQPQEEEQVVPTTDVDIPTQKEEEPKGE